jgi:hypothetical protein
MSADWNKGFIHPWTSNHDLALKSVNKVIGESFAAPRLPQPIGKIAIDQVQRVALGILDADQKSLSVNDMTSLSELSYHDPRLNDEEQKLVMDYMTASHQTELELLNHDQIHNLKTEILNGASKKRSWGAGRVASKRTMTVGAAGAVGLLAFGLGSAYLGSAAPQVGNFDRDMLQHRAFIHSVTSFDNVKEPWLGFRKETAAYSKQALLGNTFSKYDVADYGVHYVNVLKSQGLTEENTRPAHEHRMKVLGFIEGVQDVGTEIVKVGVSSTALNRGTKYVVNKASDYYETHHPEEYKETIRMIKKYGPTVMATLPILKQGYSYARDWVSSAAHDAVDLGQDKTLSNIFAPGEADVFLTNFVKRYLGWSQSTLKVEDQHTILENEHIFGQWQKDWTREKRNELTIRYADDITGVLLYDDPRRKDITLNPGVFSKALSNVNPMYEDYGHKKFGSMTTEEKNDLSDLVFVGWELETTYNHLYKDQLGQWVVFGKFLAQDEATDNFLFHNQELHSATNSVDELVRLKAQQKERGKNPQELEVVDRMFQLAQQNKEAFKLRVWQLCDIVYFDAKSAKELYVRTVAPTLEQDDYESFKYTMAPFITQWMNVASTRAPAYIGYLNGVVFQPGLLASPAGEAVVLSNGIRAAQLNNE